MNTKKGLIKTIIIIVIALIVLGFFGFNVRDIITSPSVQDNLNYVWGFVANAWDTYLKGPAEYLFDIFKNLIWGAFVSNLESIKNGHGNSLENSAPSVGTTTP